jgi:hypothetical protein
MIVFAHQRAHVKTFFKQTFDGWPARVARGAGYEDCCGHNHSPDIKPRLVRSARLQLQGYRGIGANALAWFRSRPGI